MKHLPSTDSFNEFLQGAYKGYRQFYNMKENFYGLSFNDYAGLLIKWCHSGDLESLADSIECHGEKIEPIRRPESLPL
jgi:hypothetical protein